MKRILALILSICLAGCTANAINFQDSLVKAIDFENKNEAFSPDNNKPYLSYYIDPSVGRLYSDQTSNIFIYQNTQFIMNLNVPDIINTKYYNDGNSLFQFNDNLKLFTINGEYIDYKDDKYNYLCDVFRLNDTYYLRFISKYVTFYAKGNEMSLINVSRKMIQISKSIDVKEDEVIANFSSKETIEYTKETIQLFDVIVPVNGNLLDILENKGNLEQNHGDDYTTKPNDQTQNNNVGDDYQTDDYESN